MAHGNIIASNSIASWRERTRVLVECGIGWWNPKNAEAPIFKAG
jgi:hypothetical protein